MRDLRETHYATAYEHIDDTRGLRPLAESFNEGELQPHEVEWLEERRTQLVDLFTAAGWEGDGDIECFFIPPCFRDNADTWSAPIYHVKQSNNGTSWLAIPNDLRLRLPEVWTHAD